ECITESGTKHKGNEDLNLCIANDNGSLQEDKKLVHPYPAPNADVVQCMLKDILRSGGFADTCTACKLEVDETVNLKCLCQDLFNGAMGSNIDLGQFFSTLDFPRS